MKKNIPSAYTPLSKASCILSMKCTHTVCCRLNIHLKL